MPLTRPSRREASPTGRLTTSLSNEDDWPRARQILERPENEEVRGHKSAAMVERAIRGGQNILSGLSAIRKLGLRHFKEIKRRVHFLNWI